MKVLYIARTDYGAIGEGAIYHYASLTSKHHNVRVLAPRHSTGKEEIIITDDNVEVIDIYSPLVMEQIDNAFRHISDFHPDIIHMIQSPLCFHYPYYLRHLTPYAKWLIDFRSPYIGEKNDLALKRYFYLQFYVDKILTHFMPSLKTNIRYRFRKAYEVPPGVDLSLFEDNALTSPSGRSPRNFIFIGSLHKKRKLEFLVRSFGEFKRKSKLNIKLDIFGAGNDSVELGRYIEGNSLQNCITLRGLLPQKELFKELKKYDAGIAYVPYEHYSLAPSLKSLEYSAAGIPVIASNTEGHRVYNTKYNFNFITFNNTTTDFCSTMFDIVENGFSKEMIDANKKAVQQFDWKHIIEKRLLPLYSKLIS